MSPELCSLDVEVGCQRQVVRFEIAAVDDQQLVARARELLDDGAPDEAGPSENYNSQRR